MGKVQSSKIFIFLLSAFYFLISTFVVQAAIVPCGPGTDKSTCEFCDLATLVAKVVNFALYAIALPLVVVLIVWGGLTIMTAGGSPERVKKGRSIVQSAIIGVLIALGAFLIVRTTLSVLAGSTFEPWKFGNVDFCSGK